MNVMQLYRAPSLWAMSHCAMHFVDALVPCRWHVPESKRPRYISGHPDSGMLRPHSRTFPFPMNQNIRTMSSSTNRGKQSALLLQVVKDLRRYSDDADVSTGRLSATTTEFAAPEDL